MPDKEDKLSLMGIIKKMGIVLGVLTPLVLAAIYIDAKYVDTAEAAKVEQRVVQSLIDFRKHQDAQRLDDLHRRKLLYRKLIQRDPHDMDLKEDYETIKEELKELREKIKNYLNKRN